MDAIRLRRSVREFSDEEISSSDIDLIIEAGICAPSAKNQQPWEFIVINDKNILNKLSETLSPLYSKSKVTIILCQKKDGLKSPTRVAQDMSACMQNMMLEATRLGIGSCWIGTYPDPERMNPLVETLNIPSNIEPFCGLVLGYPKNSDAFKEIKRDKIVHFNKYNA